MRPGSLYFRIFVSFAAMLLVTLALVAVMFMVGPARYIGERIEHSVLAQTELARNYVQHLAEESALPPSENPELAELVDLLGDLHQSRIWIEDSDGRVIQKSFSGPPPRVAFDQEPIAMRDIVFVPRTDDRGPYAEIPLELAGRPAVLRVLHDLHGREGLERDPEGFFLLGLLAVALAVALMTIPITRQISRPLAALRASARRIAGGDISHRADEKGTREIRQLATDFNTMTGRLSRMIHAGKELLANVSHELRTPLSRLRLSMEMARDDLERGDAARASDRLDAVAAEVDEMDRLIGRALALSRLDLAEPPPREHVDLSVLAGGLVDRFAEVFERAEIGLSTRIQDPLPAFCNPDEMHALFSNLLDNAVKYTPAGGRVELRLESADGYVRGMVANTCEPLPEEELASLFEPFRRRKDARGQGSGLGLAIVAGVVRRMQGTVTATNRDDGLEIRFEFPAGEAQG